MNPTQTTTGGTAIFQPSAKQYDAFLEARALQDVGMSVADFRRELAAGRLDQTSPEVSELIALVSASKKD